jgi:hypothetical protein
MMKAINVFPEVAEAYLDESRDGFRGIAVWLLSGNFRR